VQLLDASRFRSSSFARRALSAAGPLVWNSLSNYTREESVGEDKFEQHLKTFLFAAYTDAFNALEVIYDYALYKFTLTFTLTRCCSIFNELRNVKENEAVICDHVLSGMLSRDESFDQRLSDLGPFF